MIAEMGTKKLLVVTGKGGAGKSLLALALAHRLALGGKKIWLVEIGRKRDKDFTRLPELLECTRLSHKPELVTLPHTQVEIYASVLNPTLSLAEYVDLKLPTAGLAGVLLNNRITASLLEVVPGLPDLVTLGKLWHSVTRPQKSFAPDLIVLDAPATGHALALLRAPANFRKITKVGPIFRDASLMVEFLGDPKRTGLVLTTIPEEMSVQETLELEKNLAKDFPPPFVLVNKCFPALPALKEDEKNTLPWKAYRYTRARHAREKEAVSDLKKSQSIPFFFPVPHSPPLFLQISEALA